MPGAIRLIRTTTDNPDFQHLVSLLDHELWVELQEDQATYDQHNKVPAIQTAVLVYADGEPVACGCFKPFDKQTVEIKRMFVAKPRRGKGLSRMVLNELEAWARQQGYRFAVLETSIHFVAAIQLYQSNGYGKISNYPPYEELSESVCFRKAL